MGESRNAKQQRQLREENKREETTPQRVESTEELNKQISNSATGAGDLLLTR